MPTRYHTGTQRKEGKVDAQTQGLSGLKFANEVFRLGKESFPSKLVRLWSSDSREDMEMIQLDTRQH